MTVGQRQHQAMESLRLFNSAVTTSRLYPAVSPQVTNSVNKAFRAVDDYIKNYKELSFGKSGEEVHLCGATVSSVLSEEISGMVIFRHLALLKLDHVVFKTGIDLVFFNRLLSVFAARKEKINREGGGEKFIRSLGLGDFFPGHYSAPQDQPAGTPKQSVSMAINFETVPDEILGYLFGEHSKKDVQESLDTIFQESASGADVIAAGIARVLEQFDRVENKDLLVVSASHTRFLESTGALIPEGKTADYADRTIDILLENLTPKMFCVLCVQKYPDGFGSLLYDNLVEQLDSGIFEKSVGLLRERQRILTAQQKSDSPHFKVTATSLDKLLATPKGRQFVGRETAKKLLKKGEEERQHRRLEAGINALLGGNTESLKNDEIVYSLPATITELHENGRVEDVEKIIDRVAGEMLGGDDSLRQRLIQSLIIIGEKFLDSDEWRLLDKVAGSFVSWVRESNDGDFVYEKCVSLLYSLMHHSWETGNNSRGDQILALLHNIRTGQLPKSAPVRAMVGRIQDRSPNKVQLESLLSKHMQSRGDSNSGDRIYKLGRPSGEFLIETLLTTQDRDAQKRIVELIFRMGVINVPVIIEKLRKPLPWQGKRILIKIASEIAGPEQVENIIPFLKDEDIRVQREAFNCVQVISKDKSKEALLRCLGEAGDTLIVQVVKNLTPYSDPEIAGKLISLLDRVGQYPENVQEPLIIQILQVLSRSKSTDALHVIEQLKAGGGLSEAVSKNADISLSQLREALGVSGPTAIQAVKTTVPVVKSGSAKPPAKKEKVDYSHLPGAEMIEELLLQDQKDQAKEAILELIAKMAREREFDKAEQLREWLMAIDAMALSDIIRAAEIIEEEKVASIDNNYAEAWSELYDALTTEEFATLYHAMERRTYRNEEMIVCQGSLQSNLYFVAGGKVRIFYEDKRGENLIKVVGRGEILGAHTVFDASVWTVSASCIQKAEIMSLQIEKMLKWREDYPSLESKLSDYCMRADDFGKFFQVGGKDRRAHKRYQTSGRVSNMLLDGRGKDTGITSKGDLFDISAGGLSFFLRISQKKNARLLLGRKIRVTLPTTSISRKPRVVQGTIIAVRGRQALENEYSVHVKFDSVLSATEVQSNIRTD